MAPTFITRIRRSHVSHNHERISNGRPTRIQTCIQANIFTSKALNSPAVCSKMPIISIPGRPRFIRISYRPIISTKRTNENDGSVSAWWSENRKLYRLTSLQIHDCRIHNKPRFGIFNQVGDKGGKRLFCGNRHTLKYTSSPRFWSDVDIVFSDTNRLIFTETTGQRSQSHQQNKRQCLHSLCAAHEYASRLAFLKPTLECEFSRRSKAYTF